MAEEIDVSFVMTVYNKEFYLPSVITALLGQTGLKNPEFIFVDDVSSDNSVEIIRRMTEGVKNVTIVTNPYNRGISARINQGIALAKGKWTRMLDSDDIFPLDSTAKMLAVAGETGAEMIYGCFTKTGKDPKELENCRLEEFDYQYVPDAMSGVLNGRFTRMGQLIKTDVLPKGRRRRRTGVYSGRIDSAPGGALCQRHRQNDGKRRIGAERNRQLFRQQNTTRPRSFHGLLLDAERPSGTAGRSPATDVFARGFRLLEIYQEKQAVSVFHLRLCPLPRMQASGFKTGHEISRPDVSKVCRPDRRAADKTLKTEKRYIYITPERKVSGFFLRLFS